MKFRIKVFMIACLLLVLGGCNQSSETKETSSGNIETPVHQKREGSFYDTFDTVVLFTAYTKTQEEFDRYFNYIKDEFEHLNRLYDNYREYEGVHNIRTVNNNAGGPPIEVDRDLIDLIIFSKEWYNKTRGKTNIALGAVLEIWHEYREEALADSSDGKIPPLEELREAAEHVDIEKVVVDPDRNTLQLLDEDMSLDLGAVAKGYATDLAARKLKEMGCESAIISAGGNIRTIGKPLDGQRDKWGVGIQNPSLEEEENIIETLFVDETSVVTSGDYQRFYTVSGTRYHHLIDPNTLMPANYFRSVSIVTTDSGIADALSTAVFLLPYEEGRALVESVDGVDALWIFEDFSMKATEGMEKVMRSKGATNKNEEG